MGTIILQTRPSTFARSPDVCVHAAPPHVTAKVIIATHKNKTKMLNKKHETSTIVANECNTKNATKPRTNNSTPVTNTQRTRLTTKAAATAQKEDEKGRIPAKATATAAQQQTNQEHLHLNSVNTEASSNSRDTNNNSDNNNTNSNNNCLAFLPWLALLLLLGCIATIPTTLATPVFVDNPSLAQFQSGRNIRHLPCIVRKSGRSGVCMFAIDCIKQNGTHLGTCIDRFYFGSCCQLKDEAALFAPEISDNSIDQNTISHFPHESTTLPSSTLFKVTTSTTTPAAQHTHTVQSSSNSISETVKNVTQSYLQQQNNQHGINSASSSSSTSSSSSNSSISSNNNNKGDTTPLSISSSSSSSSSKPVRLTTTNAPRQPPHLAHTTHKYHSQFVVRTTAKPTVAPTTIKPPRRKTTVTRPILTTTPSRPSTSAANAHVEVSTQPTKFFTFQIVDTTTPAVTEISVNKLAEVSSTQRPLLTTTHRYRPRPTATAAANEVPTKFITTTTKQSESIRTTTRPKPLITRRPTSSGANKPLQTKPRPSVVSGGKPTRRPQPSDNNANEAVKPILLNITTAFGGDAVLLPHRRPPITTPPTTQATIIGQEDLPTTVVETKVPLPIESANSQTTHAPRPRPQPTAEIVRLPKPTFSLAPKTTTTTPSSISANVSTSKRPTANAEMPTKAKPTTDAVTNAFVETGTTDKLTTKPEKTQKPTTATQSTATPSTATPATATATQSPISSTTPHLATLTTETSKTELPPTVDFTTISTPGLITWTNVDSEPQTTMNATLDWAVGGEFASPANVADSNKITDTPSSTGADFTTASSPTSSTIISVATSISEIMSNNSSIMPKPERPSSMVTMRPQKPRPKPTKKTEAPNTPTTPSLTFTTAGSSTMPTTHFTVTTTTPTTTKPKPTFASTTAAPPSTTTTTTTKTAPTTTTTTTTEKITSAPPTTTTTEKITTPPSTTTATTQYTAPPPTATTELPIELAETTSSLPSSTEFSTEGFSTTGTSNFFGTTEYSTEDYNGTLSSSSSSSSTTTPASALENMDYRQICGRRMFPEPRIVGGSNAAFGRWPWQISLRQWRTSTYLHKCGAALLNENWAITAAHCVENVPPSDLLLRMGEYDLAEEEEPYGYQERRVQIVASHPQFDARTFEYDLALLRFYEPVVFQPNIIPVCVPNSDIDFVGQTAFVTGWGRLYENGPLPSVLQEVAVPVINNTICESMYRAAGFIEHIPHIFICAGWKKGGYDSCEGDSGGPMVLQREDDKRFQLGGVISWGIGCAEANQPGVYTRISEFRDWINQILQF